MWIWSYAAILWSLNAVCRRITRTPIIRSYNSWNSICHHRHHNRLMGTFSFMVAITIYENRDFGSHIHNNRKIPKNYANSFRSQADQRGKSGRQSQEDWKPHTLSRYTAAQFRFDSFGPRCLCSAFATWQNKSIIIVCHWNIVNFHQSHKTNAKAQWRQSSLLSFCYVLFVNAVDDDALCQLTMCAALEQTERDAAHTVLSVLSAQQSSVVSKSTHIRKTKE